ncbi:MAG: thiolase family protein [Ilumatobacteraceae bacterium]
MTGDLRDRTAIVGIGHSGAARDLGVLPGVYTTTTCVQAIRDAGLELSDIDGITTLPPQTPPGYNDPDVSYMIEQLGLPGVRWYGTGLGGGVGPGLIGDAAIALATGQCNYVLAFRTMVAPRPGMTYNYMGKDGASGPLAFTLPYGLGVFMQYFAPWYRRYRYERGLTDEQMGAYVVAMRDNASRNERAVFRTPITMDEYLASPFVCEPLRRFDCDLPVDVCGAFVMTTAERAKDLAQQPVYVSAVSTGTGPRPDMIFWHDYTQSAGYFAGSSLWEGSGLSPSDMDFAMMYDGFAPLVLLGLEEYGLVPQGEVGAFLESGAHRAGGALPLNPHGGNNSEGRSHAIGHVVEATLQLRGQAGTRQVPGAEACMINGGALKLAGAAVLHT